LVSKQVTKFFNFLTYWDTIRSLGCNLINDALTSTVILLIVKVMIPNQLIGLTWCLLFWAKKLVQTDMLLQKSKCQWTHYDPTCCVFWACELHLDDQSYCWQRLIFKLLIWEMYSPPIKSLNVTFITRSPWWRFEWQCHYYDPSSQFAPSKAKLINLECHYGHIASRNLTRSKNMLLVVWWLKIGIARL
jgi:hypothetical protein